MAIEVNIEVQAASIVCSSNAGNIRAKAGTEIIWRTKDSRREFTLEFFTLTVGGGDDSPFDNGATTGVVSAGSPFRAVLKPYKDTSDLGLFEYYITAGSLLLDPVIVMEKD